jgi:hypothetical protein
MVLELSGSDFVFVKNFSFPIIIDTTATDDSSMT